MSDRLRGGRKGQNSALYNEYPPHRLGSRAFPVTMRFSRELKLKGSDASREKTKEAILGARVARRAERREGGPRGKEIG